MKKQILRHCFAAVGCALLLLLLSGCRADRAVDTPSEEGTALHSLTLRLKLQGMAPQAAGYSTRADGEEAGVDDLNENKIESIRVLFFANGSLYWAPAVTPTATGSYSIPIPQEMEAGFKGQTSYKVYVVTNLDFNAPDSETDLFTQLVTEGIKERPNDKFVMQGYLSDKKISIADPSSLKLGEVQLRRVACKVRVKANISIAGYTLGNVTMSLVNAVDQGYLSKAEVPAGAQRFAYDARQTDSNDYTAVFYSYYTDWSKDPSLAPYILLTAELEKDAEKGTYSYRVPLQPRASKLEPNTLYDLTATIDQIGSSIPEDPVEVNGQLHVIPWTPHNDTYDLPDVRYLEVSEPTFSMYVVTDYTISYQSSPEPVKIKDVKASYSYTDASGTQQTKWITKWDNQYPNVTVDHDNHQIKIHAAVPVNNLPKKIEFTVTNGIDGLDKTVVAKQYPERFITNTTGTVSSLRPNGFDYDDIYYNKLTNKSIYRITVLTPPEGTILGYPPTRRTDFWNWTYGYNNDDIWDEERYLEVKSVTRVAFSDEYTTMGDSLTSQMVSPSFELASQLGATQIMGHSQDFNGSILNDYSDWRISLKTALCNCAKYTETRVVNGKRVTLSDWRLPTEAEIKLVNELQHNADSPVDAIMTGSYYWGASSKKAVFLGGKDKGQSGNGSYDQAFVRCVRDVKDNTLRVKIPYKYEP